MGSVLSAGSPTAVLVSGPDGTRDVLLSDLPALLAEIKQPDGPATWLHAEVEEGLLELLVGFGLHEVAVKSLREGMERPRVEEYSDHLYVSLLRVVERAQEARDGVPGEPAAGELVRQAPGVLEQLRVFLGSRWIISLGRLQPGEYANLRDVVLRQALQRGRGPSFVLYYLAEWVLDSTQPLLDVLDDRVDSLEDMVVLDTGEDTRQELFRLKRDLVELRRQIAPMRDVMQRLSSHGSAFIEPGAEIYFRDVHDDLLVVIEQIDTYRDILSSALDLYLSTVSNRLNEVMKRLTIVATIFMPLTFVTGFFGMNFTRLPYGTAVWLYLTLAVMTIAAVGMLAYFWRKAWL